MAVEMMAVGDSIYNGVRSATISAELAEWSVPAQVARAFGWAFVSPDYPRPVLEDFEAGLFRTPFEGAADLMERVTANARAWLNGQPWSDQPLFHNLAIAQQTVADISAANSKASLQQAHDLMRNLSLAKLPQLYQAINTAFILDPRQSDPENGRTAIGLLAEAKPKRLLVNIGINDGLWTLALMGNATDFRTAIDPTAAMAYLAGNLAQNCRDIEHVYVNLFPKPSALANLMPRRDGVQPRDGYFDEPYLGRLIQAGGITRDDMRAVDDYVREDLNHRIRNAWAPLGDRAHFVDLYAVTAAYDRKNGIDSREVRLVDGPSQILLDNFPLQALLIGGRQSGGLFGLDNLHPTIPGYGLIAQAVCDCIAAVEGGSRPVIDLQAAYAADDLLSNLPGTIALADFGLSFIGAFLGQPAVPEV